MHSISIGLTNETPCHYLNDQLERVAIAIDPSLHSDIHYDMLLANGFRRSGSTIYRPQCQQCSACQSIRIPTQAFKPSQSQKRLWKKASHLRWEMKDDMDESWFDLYASYIRQRHPNGSMFPPNRGEFLAFSKNTWLTTKYLHVYEQDRLIAIAITDITPTSTSAFYTFYDPFSSISMGTLGIMLQIAYSKQNQKTWLYLGYQIDACPAMNYKVRFQPHQKLVNQRWQG
jgi:arginine-tRNA-protein transferase